MIIIISCLLVGVFADKYAVLVAGSAGYENYRHQSDVCHSYKTLIRNGYKAENIIVFAYDDIAYNKYNPFQGTLWNRKSFDSQNDNVYDGCVIDYKRDDVSPQNFLYALSGFQELVPEGKRVLNTTSSDHIFIYFSDHGSVGLLVFPNDFLYEEEMTATLKFLYENKKYEKLVYYLEACESGSMFLNLPAAWNIYAVSAANERESSWATYCPPDDIYDGFAIGTCLGDEFSVNFLQDTDNQAPTETLDQQYQFLRDNTFGSHSLQWGDLSYTSDNIQEFLFGDQPQNSTQQKINKENVTRWDSRDVRLNYLQNKFQKTQQMSDLIELQEEKKSRELFDEFFNQISSSLKLKGDHHKSTNQKCLKQTIREFENSCFKFSDYGLKYIKYFAEACDNHLLNQVQEAIALKCLIK